MQMGLMKVNDWDISQCNARLWNMTMGHCDIINESEWISGALSPQLFSSNINFKKLTVTILVKGRDRNDILKNRSILLSKFIDPVCLTMSWMEHKFYGSMTKHSEKENSIHRFHSVTIELAGFEASNEEVVSSTDTKIINITVSGNLPTPAIVEIIPIEDTQSLTISGLTDEPIVIYRTNQGKKIIINAFTAEITEDRKNKAADIKIWELPRLLPGENTITLDYAADIIIRYEARFM